MLLFLILVYMRFLCVHLRLTKSESLGMELRTTHPLLFLRSKSNLHGHSSLAAWLNLNSKSPVIRQLMSANVTVSIDAIYTSFRTAETSKNTIEHTAFIPLRCLSEIWQCCIPISLMWWKGKRLESDWRYHTGIFKGR